MVRDAAFGADFTPKLVVALIAVGLVAWDVATRRRWDYAWVFATGAAVWTLVELSLQLRGTRVMPHHALLGAEIPLALSLPLQGVAEGAFVAVLGLFCADRVLDRRTRSRALVGFALAVVVMVLLMAISAARAPGLATAASRRDVSALGPLLVLALVVGFDVWFWARRPAHRRRSMAMAAVMVVFAAVWTLAEVTTGGRWVEVSGPAAGSFAAAPAPLAAAALAFDVVVEIALAYVPFYAIPALLGLVSPDGGHPRSRTSADAHRHGPDRGLRGRRGAGSPVDRADLPGL